MSAHNRHIGITGEALAVKHLEDATHKILKRNYRFQRWEIDIITLQKDTLHFVEVKTRTQSNYGNPELAVNNKKMQHILSVAEAFQLEFEGIYVWKFIQFDILAIQLKVQEKPSITMIEDVYLS